MRLSLLLAIIAVAGGCSTMPPPPSCDGEAKRPINQKPAVSSLPAKTFACGGSTSV